MKKILSLVFSISININLLGQIPILMYHSVKDIDIRYAVKPDVFRSHLEKLYKAGYVTAKLEDIILNKSSIQGKKVVVLRFDDSRKSQFNYIKDQAGNWVIDPDCAVAIILDFYKKYPSFGHHAIFFVVPDEGFHQEELKKQKMEFLLDNGMEIGNHTYFHDNLANATVADIDRNFGKAMEYWYNLLGSKADAIKILATPYGILPKSITAQKRLLNFFWNNVSYKPIGIALAGGAHNILCPNPSSSQFDAFALPSLEVTNTNFDSILQRLQ